MIRAICIILFFLSIILASHAKCPSEFLKIWRVHYWPQAKKVQWIEIKNTHSKKSYSCGRIKIESNGGSYTFPNELEEIPPNGKVLVYFDGLATSFNDYSFSKKNLAILHAPKRFYRIFLGNPAGFCKLFTVTSTFLSVNTLINFVTSTFFSTNTLIDFVAWGRDPGNEAKEADRKRIWSLQVYIATILEELPDGPGLSPMEVGGSLGIVDGQWEILKSFQSIPEKEQTLPIYRPELEFPNNGLSGDAANRFTIKSVTGASIYEIQISNTVNFSNILVNETFDSIFFDLKTELKGDKYYWRVRAGDKSSNFSEWSDAWTFTVTP